MKKILIGITALFILAGISLAMDNPEQRVTAVLKNYVVAKYPAWDRDEINLTFKQAEHVFSALRPYSEQATIEVLETMPDFKPVGNVIFPLLVSDGENEEKVLLRTKVEVFRPIVAAARLIKRGENLTAELLKLERRDVALLPDKYFVETTKLLSQEALIGIPANSTLFAWMIGAPPLVKRGGPVMIAVIAPGLAVKARGEALEDGTVDQEIKVKRLDSGKVLKARVKSESEVEVKL
jgi:flagellar basal body P-ring formation protein FlgA